MKIAASVKTVLSISIISVFAAGALLTGRVSAAACAVPTTDYGMATTTITIPASATYRIWSRIKAADTINNTYLLEVDGATCYNVGGGTIAAGVWTWVDYQQATSSSKVQQTLAQGTHTLKLIGNKPNVMLDRVLAVSDLSCVPNGFGDNCNVPDDTTLPAVTLTAPADGATVSGSSVTVAATASDNVGVSKVDFYDNSNFIGTDNSSPYQTTWDSTTAANGAHALSARAYDAAGNVSSDSNTVTVQNGDSQAPTTPMSVNAVATAYNKVSLTWAASTDNIGVTGYNVTRNGVPLASVAAATTYEDATVAPSSTYSYQVSAYDAAGNVSGLSAAASVTTPGIPDTQAPDAPPSLTATAVSTTQINLSWSPTTDNIGVVAYDVFRGTTKIASVNGTTTTFGDTGRTANTTYSYYVQARDAAGNISAPSPVATATTKAEQSVAGLTGKVTNKATGQPISGAKVVVLIGSRNKITYRTGTDGTYSLTLPAGGRYSVTYSKRGYVSQTVSVTVADGQVYTQNIALVRK